MRKHYTFKKTFALLATLVIAGLSHMALAAETWNPEGQVVLPGVTYEFPKYTVVKGEYTPSVTGPVRFMYSMNPLYLYSSPSHSEESLIEGTHAYTGSGQMVSYDNLEAGKTYYIYHDYHLTGGTLTVREGQVELELVKTSPSVNPEDPDYYGGKLSVSSNYTIDAYFNNPVTCGNAYLLAGSRRESINATASGTIISCDVAATAMSFYRDSVLKEGDTLTLRILSVKDAADPDIKYGTNGKVEIDFTVAAKPAEIVSTTNVNFSSNDNPFSSYYFPGDPDAVVTLEFDTPLSTDVTPVLNLQYGNTDNLDLGIYTESIRGKNEGSRAIFDLSGKLRRPIDMIPGSDATSQPTHMFGSFGSIRSIDGQIPYTGKSANPTSYPASFYINVLQYSIVADFTPVRGGKLNPGDAMEIWVRNGDKIQFDAVVFSFKKDGQDTSVEVPIADIKVEPDPYSDDAMLYNLTVPQYSCDADSKVTVSLKGLVCADGLDHNADIYAEYENASSAITIIGADAEGGLVDVYDLTGKCVLKGATPDRIRALPKGFYIAGGRKYIVK